MIGLEHAGHAAGLGFDLHRQAWPQQTLQCTRQQRAYAQEAHGRQGFKQQRGQFGRAHQQGAFGQVAHVVVQRRMKLGQHGHGLQHRHAPRFPELVAQHLGQGGGLGQGRGFFGHRQRQLESLAGGVFFQLQHRHKRLAGQVQAGQPGLDAAGHSTFARAVEAGRAAAEEQHHHGVIGQFFSTRGGAGAQQMVEQQRQQELRLALRCERLLFASVQALQQVGWQCSGHLGQQGPHGGVQLGRCPAQAGGLGVGGKHVWHHGTQGQQVQCQGAQGLHGGQVVGQVGQARWGHIGQRLQQGVQRAQRLASQRCAADVQLAGGVQRQLQAALRHGQVFISSRSGRLRPFVGQARHTHHHALGQFAEVAPAKEHRLGAEHPPQRFAQVAQGAEVELLQQGQVAQAGFVGGCRGVWLVNAGTGPAAGFGVGLFAICDAKQLFGRRWQRGR